MAEHVMRVPTNALSDAESDATKHEVDDAEDDADEELEMTEEDDDDAMTEEDDDAKGARAGSSSSSVVHTGAAGAAAEDDDDEDEDDDDDVDEDDDDEADDEIQQKQQEDGQSLDKVELSDSASMLRMLRALPELEARRHEQFRRAHFERGAIKRCMARLIQECSAADKKVPTVNNVMAIVMAGMSKVFVGEITAEARRIMEKNGETGPIRPHHLREAHRKYYARRPLARGRNLRRLLR